MNELESGRKGEGRTTGTVDILGPSPAAHFLLQALPRPRLAVLPELCALGGSWGGVKSGHSHEEAERLREPWRELTQERTLAERAVALPCGG